MMSERSSSATAPTMMMMARPSGPPVSIFSLNDTYSIFDRLNSSKNLKEVFDRPCDPV